jgi:hypothetical protein
MSDKPIASPQMLEVISSELKTHEEKTIKDAIRKMDSKEMTGEIALQYWYQIHALRKIPASIKRTGKRLAQSSSEKPVDTL